MFTENPCLKCGACCVNYRVSFYWGEADLEQGGTVPPEMTEKVDDFRQCMKGTDQKHPRCIALQGAVGHEVCCTIYERRPTPCREFGAIWKRGLLYFPPGELERCNEARAACGLPPLSLPEIMFRRRRVRFPTWRPMLGP
jgi:Fe-S-cluster containining protein